ncbi:hypothetical protein HYT54_00570 [Candidatus Woesearchaeota archaeon]|nr:hypothetical protein [Candidatus Woesearchaeota archaeon]
MARIITSIIILIVIFILYSISSNGGIVGKWQADQESGLTMTFKSDGTLLMEAGGTVISPVGLKYKIIDNKTLSIGVGTNTLTSNYEITNGKLILTDESRKLQFTKISSENSFSQIANSAKKILPTQECPQINVPLKEGIAPFIDIGEYGSWKVDSYDSTFNIHCYKGNREGQKPVYWYCGEGNSIEFPMAFIQKTDLN